LARKHASKRHAKQALFIFKYKWSKVKFLVVNLILYCKLCVLNEVIHAMMLPAVMREAAGIPAPAWILLKDALRVKGKSAPIGYYFVVTAPAKG